MLPNNAAHATLRYRDDPNGSSSGASFVVFGKPDGTAVELSDVEVGTGGFVINGVSADDLSGRSVSRAGDVNGDGFDDLIVGAPFDDPNGSASGASFVVLGGDFSGAATQVGIIGDDPLISTAGADVLFGGTGNDTIEGNGGDGRANGGQGNDIFVASGAGGELAIAGFEGGIGAGDQLDLSAFSFADFAAAATPSGPGDRDTLITLAPGNTILLQDFDRNNLAPDDLIL